MEESLGGYRRKKITIDIPKANIFGIIMPAVVLGFIPATTGIIADNIWALLFGIFFTLATYGDMMIFVLRREKNDTLVQDHPSKTGCFVYRKID
ncbi:MAG: hypothetical protein LBH92_02370 [Bacteroidales bacterium]|jgi:hypothetical protein|nr:hypothetical protein [Bacteroidales bacterium]